MDMREIFDKMPEELKNILTGAVMARVDATVSDPEKREQVRARIKEEGDPDALEGFECACNMYDLNLQVVQTLGLIKSMLSSFDETDLSSSKATANLHTFKHVAMLIGLTTENLRGRVNELGDENDNRDGHSSGPGSGSNT